MSGPYSTASEPGMAIIDKSTLVSSDPDSHSGTYISRSYLAAIGLVELPYLLMISIVNIIPFYFLIGMTGISFVGSL